MLGESEDEMRETVKGYESLLYELYICVGLGMEWLYFAALETNHSIYIAPSPN